MMAGRRLRIGCAGWTFPNGTRHCFRQGEAISSGYAQRFGAVEINSSFHWSHRTTYERWSAAVPSDFAFSVKAPKEITHSLRLAAAEAALDAFLAEVTGLGGKLGPLLFQLPPSLAFEKQAVASFFTALR